MTRCVWLALVGATLIPSAARAQTIPPLVRRLPPPGVAIPADERARLQAAIDKLAARIRGAEGEKLLPDVEIYLKAVSWALENDEFYDLRDLPKAHELLATGHRRLDELQTGKPSWVMAKGLVVRGYRSSIDGSVQPYGLVIPEDLDMTKSCPVYVWLHGRGDKNTELKFILERQSKPGDMRPEQAIVLHPFGRHCNGFKFAGEWDVFEALEWQFPGLFDEHPRPTVLCGFSMGGAGAWHIGAHYAGLFRAVSPGAGFAETARYQKLSPDKYPAWYEQALWGWYDAPCYVRNLFNTQAVAYSGELDKQIQAAQVMEEAYQAEGRKLTHLIGPGMGHKYHPNTLRELGGLLAGYAAAETPTAREVSLQTRCVRYGSTARFDLVGMEEHWREARVDVSFDERGWPSRVRTKNATAITFAPGIPALAAAIDIDGQRLAVDTKTAAGDVAPVLALVRSGSAWGVASGESSATWPRKLPELTGPIDDAFMSPFLFVTPTGKSSHPAVERWVQFELAHARDRWRRIFRGTVREKKDVDVTEDDLGQYHLVCWGDPSSNVLLKRALPGLPIQWNAETLTIGDRPFPASGHVPCLIYPNPLANSSRYFVLNSGPTFREGHDSSNSLQTPKLPDWAIIDLSQLPDALAPGRIADAGFFDEQWRYQSKRGI